MQPYEEKNPGVNAWFGNEFDRKNTWFSQLDMFTQYLKRTNMLQQGLNVADVAYFIGEDAPKMTGVRDPELPQGYQFDYINAEVILRDMTVKDGLLTLPHGTQYRVLVPDQNRKRCVRKYWQKSGIWSMKEPAYWGRHPNAHPVNKTNRRRTNRYSKWQKNFGAIWMAKQSKSENWKGQQL